MHSTHNFDDIRPYRNDELATVLARLLDDPDFNAMLKLGGNVYFLSKIFASDGLSYVQAVSTMTDMSVAEYQAMMLAGGRHIEGWRSKREQEEGK